jgi:hypothetical protein
LAAANFFRHIWAWRRKVGCPHDPAINRDPSQILTKIFVQTHYNRPPKLTMIFLQHSSWSSSNTYYDLSPTLMMIFLQHTPQLSSNMPPQSASNTHHDLSGTNHNLPPPHTTIFLRNTPQSLQHTQHTTFFNL